MKSTSPHISVLLSEVLHWLDVKQRTTIVDATLGFGGHARAILEHQNFSGSLIGIDQDEDHLRSAKQNLSQWSDQVSFISSNFSEIKKIAAEHHLTCDAMLYDLGVASPHLDDPKRGFSFQHEAPLDMRMDLGQPMTAEVILRESSFEVLARLFREYGEEPLAAKIASEVVKFRDASPIHTTTQLADLIKRVYQRSGLYDSKRHPATKVFQALRIAVNNELEVLKRSLSDAFQILAPNGRILVISYHSLEDRIVKEFFKSLEDPCQCPPKLPYCVCGHPPVAKVLTKRPVIPSEEEIRLNPRSRSAKLRVIQKLP